MMIPNKRVAVLSPVAWRTPPRRYGAWETVASNITEGLVGSLLHTDDRGASQELTPRQREVLQLLAEGRSMKEVAGVLNMTPRTVAFHKYRMMEQLKIKSTAELIQYAVKHHIV